MEDMFVMKFAVGIDVSKAKLDVSILYPDGRLVRFEVTNNPAGHKKLWGRAKKIAKDQPLHWCMEATGPYHLLLALYLIEKGELVSA